MLEGRCARMKATDILYKILRNVLNCRCFLSGSPQLDRAGKGFINLNDFLLFFIHTPLASASEVLLYWKKVLLPLCII